MKCSGFRAVLVTRMVQARTRRYWLKGEIDLTLKELGKTGSRRYRVTRQIR